MCKRDRARASSWSHTDRGILPATPCDHTCEALPTEEVRPGAVASRVVTGASLTGLQCPQNSPRPHRLQPPRGLWAAAARGPRASGQHIPSIRRLSPRSHQGRSLRWHVRLGNPLMHTSCPTPTRHSSPEPLHPQASLETLTCFSSSPHPSRSGATKPQKTPGHPALLRPTTQVCHCPSPCPLSPSAWMMLGQAGYRGTGPCTLGCKGQTRSRISIRAKRLLPPASTSQLTGQRCCQNRSTAVQEGPQPGEWRWLGSGLGSAPPCR